MRYILALSVVSLICAASPGQAATGPYVRSSLEAASAEPSAAYGQRLIRTSLDAASLEALPGDARPGRLIRISLDAAAPPYGSLDRSELRQRIVRTTLD